MIFQRALVAAPVEGRWPNPAPNGAKEFNIAFNVAAGIEHGALDACPLRLSSRLTRPGLSQFSSVLVSVQYGTVLAVNQIHLMFSDYIIQN